MNWDTGRDKGHLPDDGVEDRFRTSAAKRRADVVSHEVIGSALEVHRRLGPGLLESAYRACLVEELKRRRLGCIEEMALPINYKGLVLLAGYRLDVLVEDLVVVELKAVQVLEPIHETQLLTYLRLSRRWLGLLINFNSVLLKHGIRRRLNG